MLVHVLTLQLVGALCGRLNSFLSLFLDGDNRQTDNTEVNICTDLNFICFN